LIELLVVIAIIALLVSILMPSLKRARELALSVSCLSQTRNLGSAAMLHVTERDGRLPLAGLQWGIPSFTPAGLDDASENYYLYYTDSGTRRVAPMTAQLGQYMGMSFRTDSRANMEDDVNRSDVARAFGCPALSEPQEGKIVLGKQNGWRDPIVELSSYAFSEGILGYRGAISHDVADEPPAGRLNRIKNASETLFAQECEPWPNVDSASLLFFDIFPPGSEHATFWDFWDYVHTHGTMWGASVPFYRHNHKMSAVFVDGHSESVETGESEEMPAIDAWEKNYVIY